ncbi:MAG: N,N-dimethylformamidase [Proteobacteria bacterium]|nr:N,N-dimethylformamidase [Pseudomonadota bacterium]
MIGRILAYSDRISARPGEEIAFKVSCDGPGRYEAEIVRLWSATDAEDGPGLREVVIPTPVNGSYPGRFQPVRAGSHAVVAEAGLDGLSSFTLACAIWPTTPGKGEQALIGTLDGKGEGGFRLLIDAGARPCLRLATPQGTQDVAVNTVLLSRTWYRLAASWDAATGTAELHCLPCPGAASPLRPAMARASLPTARPASTGPLLMAAARDRAGELASHFNGKLEAPRLLQGASAQAAELQGDTREIPAVLSARVLGWWDFSLEIPSRTVVDRSPWQRHGRTVNLPARAMKGLSWDGSAMDWRANPAHYGAIHFHDDDLDDCRWETDFTLTVPQDMASGCYAARLSSGGDEEYAPFYVRTARDAGHADIVFLASTASHNIYGNYHKAAYSGHSEVMNSGFTILSEAAEYLSRHPELSGSTYDWHTDASGMAYATRLRPMLNMRPKTDLWYYDVDSLVVDWIDRCGLDCDVVTDEDLHLEGLAALEPYRVVVTGHHPEYYSPQMLKALAAFTERGGRLMYLGGNGFYWKIAFDPENPAIVEVRRSEGGIRAWAAEPGEAHHSFDGGYGGLWRRAGYAPNRLCGVGFTAQGFDGAEPYWRMAGADDPRAAFIWDSIEDDKVGDFGLFGGGAAGVETDRYDADLGSPPHALIVGRSRDHTPGIFRVPEELLATHNMIDGTTNPLVRADLVFFETAGGGAVFSVGSMAWVCALPHNGYDNNVARMSENVLRRFADSEPFVLPGEDRMDGRDQQTRESGSDGVVEGMGYRT